MKRLRFLEVMIMSQIEKKGTRVKFHPQSNLIIGKNDTGKSSLVKSLFRAFGAETENHPRWKSAKVSILLKFAIDRDEYSVLRFGDLYSFFDKNGNILHSFNSVTNEIAPFLSEIIDFKLKLPDKHGKIITPPPAYYFLPFYIDQDQGWTGNWSSFENLGQLSNWRKNVAEYHTGIRPNEYYELLNKANNLSGSISEKNGELRIHSNILRKVDENNRDTDFDIDVKAFLSEIESLLIECEKLKEREDALKTILSDLYNKRIHLEAQIKLVENSHGELIADFNYANKEIGDSVECPICGATYENSFSERFAIAQDENRCFELLQQLRNDLVDIDRKISSEKQSFQGNSLEVKRISELLEIKKSKIRFQEIIETEGKREVKKILKNDIQEKQNEIMSSEGELGNIKKNLKLFDKNEKRTTILVKYLDYMRSSLFELGVHNLDEKSYRRIDSKISEIGSDRPRALLAYFYSIIKIMVEFSSSAFCPIVIDSPNQQDQDDDNLLKMLNFITKHKPADSQLILASADVGREIPFKGNRIELSHKDSLLSSEHFKEISKDMNEYISQSLFRS
jgi:hypothetical protein